MEAESAEIESRSRRRWFRKENGAVGTEMAIVVAIVVGIALALGIVMRSAATGHSDCIAENPADALDASCTPAGS